MRPHLIFTIALTLTACGSGGGDDSGTGTGTTGTTGTNPDKFAEVITVDVPATGDLACFTTGSAWNLQTVDASCVGTAPFTNEIIDFETGDVVADATVELFLSDSVNGAPDNTYFGDSSGIVSGTAPVCAPFSYRVTTDPVLAETKVSIEAHQVYGYSTSLSEEFNSVSTVTYQIIPSLLGISVDPTMGIVAGTAYDCVGDPIEGAQVIVKDAAGRYPDSQEIRYFVEEFPNRNQPYTSEDGLWVAVNIPPGRVTVELWMVVGSGAPVLMGATELDIFADSINISNITVGNGDGVVLPASCLTTCTN